MRTRLINPLLLALIPLLQMAPTPVLSSGYVFRPMDQGDSPVQQTYPTFREPAQFRNTTPSGQGAPVAGRPDPTPKYYSDQSDAVGWKSTVFPQNQTKPVAEYDRQQATSNREIHFQGYRFRPDGDVPKGRGSDISPTPANARFRPDGSGSGQGYQGAVSRNNRFDGAKFRPMESVSSKKKPPPVAHLPAVTLPTAPAPGWQTHIPQNPRMQQPGYYPGVYNNNNYSYPTPGTGQTTPGMKYPAYGTGLPTPTW